MKNMYHSITRNRGNNELKQIFIELGIKDGLTEDVKNCEFAYWHNKARNGEKGNYIIFEVISSDPIYRTDDIVFSRDYYAQIDIFSIYIFEQYELIDLVDRLERKLVEHSFEVDIQDEIYEEDTGLHHIIMLVDKLYFSRYTLKNTFNKYEYRALN